MSIYNPREETEKELSTYLRLIQEDAQHLSTPNPFEADVSDLAYAEQERAVALHEELLRLEKRKLYAMGRLRDYQKFLAGVKARPEGWIDCPECDDGWEWVETDYSTEGGYHQECSFCDGKRWLAGERADSYWKAIGIAVPTPTPTDA